MRTLLAAVLLPALAVPLFAAESGLSVRLGAVTGSVWTRSSAAVPWAASKDGAMLAPGVEARTGRGASAVLAFSDGNKVRLGPATVFAVEGATTLKTSLRLLSGRLEAWVRRANKADFTVRHRAGVAAVRGTVFAMEANASALDISLFSGALDVVDSFGRPASLNPGQSARVSADAGFLGIAPLPPGTAAPAEPDVETPAPPAAAAAETTDAPPDELTGTETESSPAPSPTQESETTDSEESTVSPSSP